MVRKSLQKQTGMAKIAIDMLKEIKNKLENKCKEQ